MGKLTALPDLPATPGAVIHDLRDAVQATFAAMPWLTPADEAMKSLAMRMADHIEEAQALADEVDAAWDEAGADQGIIRRLTKLEAAVDVSNCVARIGPQLAAILKLVGGAPQARKALQVEKHVGGRLAALRSASGNNNS